MEEQNTKQNLFNKPIIRSIIGIVSVFILLGGFLFWQANNGTLFVENSYISAPIINLSGSTAGTLNALYVKEGDIISANTPVALVGTDIVTSKQSGIVISTTNNIGTFFAPGETVVSMIHPEDMRVVGAVDENKGLEEIKPGQKASFTVDTFGSKTYVGVVDSVSQTADDTGVVFSISDKRPTEKFDVKVRFNVADYPELKNGMSAKITIYVK
ncbi:MAG TPA: HlyD family efflux transporter periplasmic adaptor subunit [Candidatus Paceibacterota bacterium]|nr:HlyD family efflux transporter periplasmic adaptor subunit [Candidatus Paceibacterota bacterium]